MAFARAATSLDAGRVLAAPLAAVAVTVAAFGCVAAVDPNVPGRYPACPVLSLTGLACPACGGLRSAHAFAHGDAGAAVAANPLAALSFAALALLLAVWLAQSLRARPFPFTPRPAHAAIAGAVTAAFTVARNVFGVAG
ncbi:DUF2752 domain-containing protein [Streptomyces sp. SBT349]|uniref:DUF2752 domain-containing protein n=1 Tax=Streptomyces sp. SBT349 TaxID=1580539 RepID=UPI000D149F6B|nr:DUF2752 domain-containing protein [Streptomyces sp. SBT349]